MEERRGGTREFDSHREGYIYSDLRCYSPIFVDQSAEPDNTNYFTVSAVRG